MARVLNGSSQYLSASSTLLTNEPIGMFAWFNSGSSTAGQGIISLGNNGAAGFLWMPAAGNVASDPVQAQKQTDAGTAAAASSSAGYSTSTWQAGGASFRSDTSRDAYLNGANKGSNTTSIGDPTPDFVTIGALRRNAVGDYFNGSIAGGFLFDYAPTDAEHALLAAGIHPIDAGIPVANIRGWYPLLATDNNSMAGGYPDLSASGSPTFGDNPPNIIYPHIGGLISI